MKNYNRRLNETKDGLNRGYSKERIAAELGVSSSTVERYISELKGYTEKEEADEKQKEFISRMDAQLKKENIFKYLLIKHFYVFLILGFLTIKIYIGIILLILGVVGIIMNPRLNPLSSGQLYNTELKGIHSKVRSMVPCIVCGKNLGYLNKEDLSKKEIYCSFCGAKITLNE